jgi:hypothetical protein
MKSTLKLTMVSGSRLCRAGLRAKVSWPLVCREDTKASAMAAVGQAVTVSTT